MTLSPMWSNLGPSGQTWGLLDGLGGASPPFPVLPGQPVLCAETTFFLQSSSETEIINCEGGEGTDC